MDTPTQHGRNVSQCYAKEEIVFAHEKHCANSSKHSECGPFKDFVRD